MSRVMVQVKGPGEGGRGMPSEVAPRRLLEGLEATPSVSSSPRRLHTRRGLPTMSSIVRACSGDTVVPRVDLMSVIVFVTRVFKKVRAAGVSRKSTWEEFWEVQVTCPGPMPSRNSDTTSDSAREGVVTMGVHCRLEAWELLVPISYSSSPPSKPS